tara:strand:+ start:297 stop:1121 length:825 start_codon:yes stop_codon:yes gene_type:complete
MRFRKKNNVWRLILDIPRSGSFNMAADQFLLESFIYNSKPVFRIYEWETPTISIGRNEVLDQGINLLECENLGIPVIRRITGGQAVLHGFDITYSFVGSIFNSKFSGNVLENYRYISKGFYKFFKELGLNPEYYNNKRQIKNLDNHICFAVPSNYEILVEGKKIIGNAQKVKKIDILNNSSKRVFLQHGSILLNNSFYLISKIFPNINIKYLTRKIHSLESIGVFPRVSKNKIKELIYKSFQENFDLEWEYKFWNDEELSSISNYEKKFKSIKS